MSESTFDDIFDDLIDPNEELQSFLNTLDALLAEAAMLLVNEAGDMLAGVRPLDLARTERERMVHEARAAGGFVAGKTVDGSHCLALNLAGLPAVLILACPVIQAADRRPAAAILSLLQNSIDLAMSRQERDMLVADHAQAVRQINILQKQHGKLIEDNYRQYRFNQEREKEYARELESEIARQTAELREANARLEEISRLKSDFLANMSHELRTPMNAIIGFSELLAETPLSEEQLDYARTISQSAASLLTLINDILDLAKIESGKLELERESFNLAEVIDNVVAMFKIPAKTKGVAFARGIDPRIPQRIMGDSNRLRQVLINLAGNAMKFTAAGEISIQVSFEGEADGRIVSRFSVRDSGIGIPADRIGAIFEKFTQADGSTTRKYGGTGLGLSISLQLVELMGGHLAVESEVGLGSTFYFDIPLEEAPSEALPLKEHKNTDSKKAGGGKILLVEDNAVNQRLASILITREGYEVEVASDGLEALAYLQRHTFDLVLMDVQMPNMDGMEATRRIRAAEADPALRQGYAGLRDLRQPLAIVGLTANARKEDETACYEAGMNGFLTKPIVKVKLLMVMNEMMPQTTSP